MRTSSQGWRSLSSSGQSYLTVYPQGGPVDVDGYGPVGMPASAVTLVLADGQRVAGAVTVPAIYPVGRPFASVAVDGNLVAYP